MIKKIAVPFIFILAIQLSKAQSIEWLNIIDDYSFGLCVEKTYLGYLVLGGRYVQKGMGALFYDDGSYFWQESFCNCDYYGISYNTELPDGRLLFVGELGDLIVTDIDGKNVDSLFSLGLADSKYNNNIFKGLRYDSILFLIGNPVIHNKFQSTIQKLSLNSLRILSQQTDSINQNLTCMHVYPDASMLTCYSGRWRSSYLMKSDKNGNAIWKKVIFPERAVIKDMIITDNQSIYLSGNISDSTGQRLTDGLLVKLDSLGEPLWIKTYKATKSLYPPYGYKEFNRMQLADKNEIILGGTDGDLPIGLISDMSIMSIDLDGNINWELFKHVLGEGNEVKDFTFNDDRDIIAVGTSAISDFGKPERAFIMKIKRPLASSKNIQEYTDFTFFPNPATNSISINSNTNLNEMQLQILDTYGKLLYQSQFKSEIDLHNIESGQYYIRLKSGRTVVTRKLTILKTD
jgi:hypothetical protein